MIFLLQPRVARLLAGRFFEGISAGLLMMALPWILLKDGNNGSVVAIIALICTLCSFLLTPFFSTAVDRYSRKTIMVIVQLAQAIAALFLLIVFTLPAEVSDLARILSIAAVQLVFWVSADLAWNTTGAFIQENFQPDEYPRISAYQEVMMQGVMLTSGGFGILLLESWSLSQFALFALCASTLSALCYSTMPYLRKLREHIEQSFHGQLVETRKIFLRDPQLMIFLAMSCLSYPILTYLVKLVPVFLAEQGYSGEWFAVWKSSYGLGAMVCGLVITVLLAKFRSDLLMVVSVLLIALSLGVMAIVTEPVVIIAMTLGIGFFNATNRISRINRMNLTTDIQERGRIDGGLKMFSILIQSLSYMLIALLSSWQLTHYGFAVAAVVMLLAGGYMYRFQANNQKQQVVPG